LKKIISALALSAVLAVGGGSAASAAEQKIAVVDIAAVFQQLPQREKIVKQLKEEFELRIQELKNLEKEILATQEKGKRDGALMSEKEQTQLSRRMDELQSDYTLKRKALEEDERRRNAEERNKLLSQVQKAIDKIAAKEGYTLVLQRNAAVFAAPELDISEKVIQQVSK